MSAPSKTCVTDGLVLRRDPYLENDSICSLLTAERGRITVIAKGARSMKSALRSGIEPYTYGNFEIAYRKDGPGWLRGASVTNAFAGLRTSLLPLSLAAYLSDLAASVSDEGVEAGELLQLCLNTLYLLSERTDPNDEAEILRVKAGFEMRIMAISGYAPKLSHCALCGAPILKECYLDVTNGELRCGECVHRASESRAVPPAASLQGAVTLLPLSPAALGAMQYVVTAPPKRLYSFLLPDEESLRAFSAATEAYAEYHLERSFDSLRFFNAMRNDTAGK